MSLLLERLKTKLSTASTAIRAIAKYREFTGSQRENFGAGSFEGCNHGKPPAPRSIEATYFRANLGEPTCAAQREPVGLSKAPSTPVRA